jgi:hypothetical protein
MGFAPGWFTTISCNNNKYLLHNTNSLL